eukprot:gene11167-14985_t
MTDEVNQLQIAIRTISAVSCLFSSLVMITYHVFPEMNSKIFMKFIYFISLSDFCMNLTSLIGFPPNGSVLCWIQGMCQNYFAIASWLWTTAVSFTLYGIVLNGKVYFKFWQISIMCWGIPLLPTLLPLITNTYGAGNPDAQWCLIIGKNGTPSAVTKFWSYGSFFLWLFTCLLLMSAWQIIVYFRFLKSSLSSVVKSTYDKVWLYPLVMGLCWVLNFLCVAVIPHDEFLVVGFSMICGIFYGILTSCIFFWKSNEAIARWKYLLFGDKRLKFGSFSLESNSDNLSLSVSPSQHSIITIPSDFMDDDYDYSSSDEINKRTISTISTNPLNDL